MLLGCKVWFGLALARLGGRGVDGCPTQCRAVVSLIATGLAEFGPAFSGRRLWLGGAGGGAVTGGAVTSRAGGLVMVVVRADSQAVDR